jgi:uncharacterized protein
MVERRAEAVQEGDAAELWAGSTRRVGSSGDTRGREQRPLDLVKEDLGEGGDGAGSVGEEAAQSLGPFGGFPPGEPALEVLRDDSVERGLLGANVRTHGISFEEVTVLFTSGADYLEIFDDDHSHEEERFICVGPIARDIILAVIVDVGIDLIRIISARRATRRESVLYGQCLEERSGD